MTRKKVLFLSEAVTWSQVVRLVVLARSLDPSRYEVHFAAARFDPVLFAGTSFQQWPIFSLTPEQVDRAVRQGRRIYGRRTLARYVKEELELFAKVRPDLVVSDLRWSTAISCPVASIPCATLINAYWSKHTRRAAFPLPDHPIVRLLGVKRAAQHFPKALPFVFRHFAQPVNALRKQHGLAPLGDLFDVITWGDRTLFPDDPSLVRVDRLEPGQTFLGPVTWSAQAPLPSNWDSLGTARPLVYVTLGSSGALEAIPKILDAVARMDVDVLLSTAQRAQVGTVPPNVTVAEVVPGEVVARRAAVVVCNGGASTGYQALSQGTPIVGIPQNLDAWLAMTAMRDAGAGLMLRASTLTAAEVQGAVERVIGDASFRLAAQTLRSSFAQFDIGERFSTVVAELTGCERPTGRAPSLAPSA